MSLYIWDVSASAAYVCMGVCLGVENVELGLRDEGQVGY